jgi:hypothetical protein
MDRLSGIQMARMTLRSSARVMLREGPPAAGAM